MNETILESWIFIWRAFKYYVLRKREYLFYLNPGYDYRDKIIDFDSDNPDAVTIYKYVFLLPTDKRRAFSMESGIPWSIYDMSIPRDKERFYKDFNTREVKTFNGKWREG